MNVLKLLKLFEINVKKQGSYDDNNNDNIGDNDVVDVGADIDNEVSSPAKDLMAELQAKNYKVNIIKEEKALKWLNKIMPIVIYDQLIEPGSLKKCGTVATFIAGLAAKEGIAAGVVSEPGHFVAYIPVAEGGALRIDATHLQFKFSYGGLRDFPVEDRTIDNKEQPLMNPPPEISDFFNPKLYGQSDDLDIVTKHKDRLKRTSS